LPIKAENYHMRKAIIDLGTNTFNLLIASVEGKEVEIVYKAKMPSKLGEEGINSLHIHEDARSRGIRILKEYKKIIDKHGVQAVHAIATSAVRTATNGKEFVNQIAQETGIYVDIISGEKEAELIYRGVNQSYNKGDGNYLILDIGGGSTEFILVENNKISELRSFKLGMARLMEKFNPSDPMKPEQVKEIRAYLKTELDEFFSLLKTKHFDTLIGSSGSFDTILSMIAHKYFKPGHFKKKLSSNIANEHFLELHDAIVASTLCERHQMPGMDLIRIEMMPLAMVFTKFVYDELNVENLAQSRYALKEGLLFSL
jgi:exopolyphosphatase/guanosine-5'-triphosphate,3'-diphosphate pyrophosphatase